MLRSRFFCLLLAFVCLLGVGSTALAAQVETKPQQKQLFESGVTMLSGPVSGQPITEDEMIRDCIVRQYR